MSLHTCILCYYTIHHESPVCGVGPSRTPVPTSGPPLGPLAEGAAQCAHWAGGVSYGICTISRHPLSQKSKIFASSPKGRAKMIPYGDGIFCENARREQAPALPCKEQCFLIIVGAIHESSGHLIWWGGNGNFADKIMAECHFLRKKNLHSFRGVVY